MNISTFPTLFGESSHGKHKKWSVSVSETPEKHGVILTTHGYVDGKQVESRRVVTEGKNLGKKNATTALAQATSEAQALWNKKKDAGYTASVAAGAAAAAATAAAASAAVGGAGSSTVLSAPSAPTVPSVPTGVLGDRPDEHKSLVPLPMLAHDYNKRGKSMTFPCYVQRKLDGVRCVAIPSRGLYSRNGKMFPHLEHIRTDIDQLGRAALTPGVIFDGELYSDELSFQEIVGLVKKETLRPEDKAKMKKIYLFVYDCIVFRQPAMTYKDRYESLQSVFSSPLSSPNIRLLSTAVCASDDEMKRLHSEYVAEGYEGIILRQMNGVYKVGHRSPELQKYKEFFDAEYPVIGFKQGEGEEKGCVIWQCRTPAGLEFAVRPRGTRVDRAELFTNGATYIGKLLTVRYQELTTDGIPRFPVGISFRDYE
jgi:ATP-dependent DNA ligase